MKEERGEGRGEKERGGEKGEGRGKEGGDRGGRKRGEGRGEGEERRKEKGGQVPVHHHELFLSHLRHNVDNFVADIQTLEEGISCFQQNLFLFPFSL